MDFHAERVSELTCGRCGERIDPSGPKPLTVMPCPRCGAKVRVPAVFGDFLLGEVLGSGAAGIVCKALDQQLHRQVAIKILRRSEGVDELVEQCTREARALAALNHPHVVQVHSIGEYRGQPFIVMELLDGGDVQRAMIGKRNDELAALDVAIDAAEGLAAAHRAGLVHMDVKPGNILYSRAGVAKVIDFGVAQVARRAGDQVAGTPYYVAPEVIRGRPADFKADIYSLGSTLFHLLAARPPFEADSVARLLKRKLKYDPPYLLGVRDDVRAATANVVARMLAPDPDHRYGSYDELLADLRGARAEAEAPPMDRTLAALATASTGAAAAPPKPAAGATRRPRREALPIGRFAGVAAAAAVLVAVLAVVLSGGGDDPDADARPLSAGQPNPPEAVPDPSPAASAPIAPLIPVASRTGPFATDPRWTPLELKAVESTGGATAETQPDGSVRFSGKVGDTETYKLTGSSELPTIRAIALEVMPDDSLDRGGPGRSGNFFLAKVAAAASPAESPGDLVDLKLVQPEASYEQRGYPIAHTLDDKLDTAWAIGTRFARAHTATYRLAEPVNHAGGSVVRVTLTHHKGFKQYIGRLRIWVTGHDSYRPAIPVTVAPATVPVAAPAPPKAPTPPPAPTPPQPPRIDPVTADHAALYPDDESFADTGQWSTLDIVSTTSSGGATLTKQPDGSILVSGELRNEEVYTVVVRTTLKGITGFRLDADPDPSLPQGGPGRNKDGLFIVKAFAVAAGDDAASAAPVTLQKATSAVNRPTYSAANVLTDRNNGWGNPQGTVNRPMSMTVLPAEKVAQAGASTLVFTIAQHKDQALGRFRLGATTGDPAAATPLEPLKPAIFTRFVTLTPRRVTGERDARFAIQPDASVLVDSKLALNNTYTVELETPPVPITMLRLEAMTDESLPKGGPGLPANGAFAVSEIELTAAAKGQATAGAKIVLGDASATYHEDKYPPDLAVDGNATTFWAMIKRAGETHELTLRPQAPIHHPGGSLLTLSLSQRMALGRFRVSATAMADPTPLRAQATAEPPPAAGDAAPAAGAPVAQYFNFGGASYTDPQGRVWEKALQFRTNVTPAGYEGRVTNELTGTSDDPRASATVNVLRFKSTVPNGVYNVTMIFSNTNKDIVVGKRRFTISVEGRVVEKDFDVVTATRQQGFATVPAKVRVEDGVLDIEFTRSPGTNVQTSISGLSIVAER